MFMSCIEMRLVISSIKLLIDWLPAVINMMYRLQWKLTLQALKFLLLFPRLLRFSFLPPFIRHHRRRRRQQGHVPSPTRPPPKKEYIFFGQLSCKIRGFWPGMEDKRIRMGEGRGGGTKDKPYRFLDPSPPEADLQSFNRPCESCQVASRVCMMWSVGWVTKTCSWSGSRRGR